MLGRGGGIGIRVPEGLFGESFYLDTGVSVVLGWEGCLGGCLGFPVSLQSGRGQDNFMFAGPGQESSRSPDGIARGF